LDQQHGQQRQPDEHEHTDFGFQSLAFHRGKTNKRKRTPLVWIHGNSGILFNFAPVLRLNDFHLLSVVTEKSVVLECRHLAPVVVKLEQQSHGTDPDA
jgi:hypothetical protein